MTRKWIPDDPDDVIERYLSGASAPQLGRELGVSRTAIRRFLISRGITPRTNTEANRLLAEQRSPEERARLAAPAQAAVRGKRRSHEELVRRAQTRERRMLHASPDELLLREWLAARGIESVPQKAVDKYNLDLAVGPVAVELFGGAWHLGGRHAARAPERFRYLLDQGWTILVVWVDRRRWPLRPEVADQVVALLDRARRDPSASGQYWVVRGNGEALTACGDDLDHLALIPSLRRAAR